MANRPFKIPKDTKGNEYFPVTTTDAIIYSGNGEKKVLTEVIKKDLEDLSSLIIDEENRVLKEDERRAAEISRTKEEDIRTQNEEDRKANELTRQNSFSSNEAARQKTFNDNESARQNTFIKAESQRETAETIRQEEELKRQEAETIRQENYDKKVDRTDNAPELTAGFAGNLVGRGEATSEEIGFRPSGGLTSVNDGAARIERLKGNTLVWNQSYPTDWTSVGLGIRSVSSDGIISLNGTATATYFNLKGEVGVSSIPYAHKGLYHLDIINDDSDYLQGKKFGLLNRSSEVVIEGKSVSFFYVNDNETSQWGFGFARVAIGDTIADVKIRVSIYDLTQMFGAGNEPTTIEEFNARKPLGIDEYAYNEGELISTTADEIKSVGFNAWDGVAYDGYVDYASGVFKPDGPYKRTGYIRVLPNMDYYVSSTPLAQWGAWYDLNKNFISGFIGYNTVMKSPNNAAYIALTVRDKEASTIDLCIHLVHTGYRNGEYEPYEEFRRSLPISEIKDSEGNALFPNGLLSAGSVYDEITATKAIKRIGVVDMGTLKWGTSTTVDSSKSRMQANISDMAVVQSPSVVGNAICSKFETISANDTFSNVQGIAVETYQRVSVYDPSNTESVVLFQSAMSGVMLYYELAEPIEVDLPEPINMDYEVSDFGTEEVISDTPTTPLKADIIYQFNAVDRIRENSANIKKIEDKLDDISVDLLTPITYSSLKALRDGGSLVKGMWYRITDYVTTTKQSETKSAGHPFDVIVLATSENELSHLARAIAHDGDTYFDGNDLGAWELWYDLDNDTTKYEWADATNGKGVIYRMIDEKRNDCPYDFKNVLFYNDKYTSNTTSDKYYYTFSYVVSGKLYDGTVEKQVTNCYGNSMGVYIKSKKRSLNSNVWRNAGFGNSCYSNTFGDNCFSNTFEYNYHSNTFGNRCNSNTFGNNCNDNIFEVGCSGNIFGLNCTSNTFGPNCAFNTFGSYCNNNTFGNLCRGNIFGDGCSYNTFENGCYGNFFGNGCNYNTFGNGCYSCGFYNSSEFDYNEDKDAYLGTGVLINDVMNCRFGDSCEHLLIHTTDGVKNLFVSQNLCSLTENEDGYMLPEVIEVDEYGDYELKIARNRDGEIKVYCEADLV